VYFATANPQSSQRNVQRVRHEAIGSRLLSFKTLSQLTNQPFIKDRTTEPTDKKKRRRHLGVSTESATTLGPPIYVKK
jgi:hypothetical protein